MQATKLAVEPRTATGKGGARKLRRSGRVPAVLYRDGTVPTLFSLDPDEFELTLRREGNRNMLFEVSLDGQTRVCIIKDFQRHPVSRVLRHIDFYEVLADKPLVVNVRIEPMGRAEGTRLGGTLNMLRRSLEVLCLPGDIPVSLQVDVTPLNVGDFIAVAEIEVPPSATILCEGNFNVVTVLGKRHEEEEEEEEGEEAEDAEGADGEASAED